MLQTLDIRGRTEISRSRYIGMSGYSAWVTWRAFDKYRSDVFVYLQPGDVVYTGNWSSVVIEPVPRDGGGLTKYSLNTFARGLLYLGEDSHEIPRDTESPFFEVPTTSIALPGNSETGLVACNSAIYDTLEFGLLQTDPNMEWNFNLYSYEYEIPVGGSPQTPLIAPLGKGNAVQTPGYVPLHFDRGRFGVAVAVFNNDAVTYTLNGVLRGRRLNLHRSHYEMDIDTPFGAIGSGGLINVGGMGMLHYYLKNETDATLTLRQNARWFVRNSAGTLYKLYEKEIKTHSLAAGADVASINNTTDVMPACDQIRLTATGAPTTGQIIGSYRRVNAT